MLSDITQKTYQKLAEALALQSQNAAPFVVGINGSQGSGKSTLAAWLTEELAAKYRQRAITISIDDFYLSSSDRQKLATEIHPLLATRGVPGTHDVTLGQQCMQQLLSLDEGEYCELPRFNKALDDCHPASENRIVNEKPDIIIFEGWCVGVPAQSPDELIEPVNALEALEDEHQLWRQFVNHQLETRYREWFSTIDCLVFLKSPSWAQILQWREQQEQETATANQGQSHYRDPKKLQRFMQHYQRLTEVALQKLPSKAAFTLRLDAAHNAHW